jgi:predicted transcriptional regulator
MSTTARGIQQKVHELADQLPEDATWEDVMEAVRFRRAVEAGIAAADRGAFAPEGDVRAAFAKWDVEAKGGR